jgi:hypothetical protein
MKRKIQAELKTELSVTSVPYRDAMQLAKIGNGYTYKGARTFHIEIGELKLTIFVELDHGEEEWQWENIVRAVSHSEFAVDIKTIK